ncbi:MAG: hypothetical protein GKR94_09985 [Gammaproteobacteria bacterium]|nr:hypothetical protein [Gammaproteobacteria bacterium]
MGEVNWTAEAHQWLEDIFEYIALENPGSASRIVGNIYERAQVLKEFPQIGYRYEASERNVRILLHGRYRIAYLVKNNNDVDICCAVVRHRLRSLVANGQARAPKPFPYPCLMGFSTAAR